MSRFSFIPEKSLMMIFILIELISVSSSVGGVESLKRPGGTTVDLVSTFSTAPTVVSPVAPVEDSVTSTTDPESLKKIGSRVVTTLDTLIVITSPRNASSFPVIPVTPNVTTEGSRTTFAGRRKMIIQQDKMSSGVNRPPETTQEVGRVVGTPSGGGEEDEGYSTSPRMSKNGTRKTWCRNRRNLDQCLSQVPPMPDIGIPSSNVAVQTACKAFNVGMGCVDTWTKRCLKPDSVKVFQESISGAHETFAFLCRDSKFRTAYLKHGECYRKISPKWDECSRNFIEDMKLYHYQRNTTIHCCIRYMFLTCVAQISHYHCDRGASEFLQKMAETLIRSTMKFHTPPQCVSIHPTVCALISSSQSLAQIHGTNVSFVVLARMFIGYLFSVYWVY